MTCEFELIWIHSNQLADTVQEEDEEWTIVFAVVYVEPMLHLALGGFHIGCNWMAVNWFTIWAMQYQRMFASEIMLEE